MICEQHAALARMPVTGFNMQVCVEGGVMADGPIPLDELTPRERECLVLVAKGLSSKEIGQLLGLESTGVDTHLKRAARRTGVSGRMRLARLLVEQEPELTQYVTQRLGRPPISVAERSFASAPERAASNAPERSWGDLPTWQKRLWAVAIAFGALALAALLVAVGRHVLGGATRLG